MTLELKDLPLFRDLTADDVEQLRQLVRLEVYAAGQVIFREGDVAKALYVVEEGAVTLFQEKVGSPVRLLAKLGAGQMFGEMGLLTGDRRRATARARTAARLLALGREGLVPFFRERPLLELRLRNVAFQRHQENVAAALDPRQRQGARMRIAAPVVLTFEDGSTHHGVLENLSTGGLCLGRAPEVWRAGGRVRFQLGTLAEPGLLQVEGRVAWVEAERLGIAFVHAGLSEARVRQVLRSCLP